MATHPECDVKLHNVARFTDIELLTAYYTKHIAADFEFEDLDMCTQTRGPPMSGN